MREENSKVEHTNRLCDSHGSTETNNLDCYKKQDFVRSDLFEWLIRWHRDPFADKIIYLCCDPVAIQGI